MDRGSCPTEYPKPDCCHLLCVSPVIITIEPKFGTIDEAGECHRKFSSTENLRRSVIGCFGEERGLHFPHPNAVHCRYGSVAPNIADRYADRRWRLSD